MTDPNAKALEPHVAPGALAEESSDSRWQSAGRLALSLALLAFGVYVIADYLRALAWAVVFAIALWPLYERVRSKMPRALSGEALPILFTFLTGFVFLLPFALLVIESVREVHEVVDYGRQFQSGVPAPPFLDHIPYGGAAVANWWNAHLSHEGWLKDVLQQVNTSSNRELGRSVGVNVIHRVFLFGISLMALFFLFRDGRRVADQVLTAARRLFGPRGERVARHMSASIHGTVNGLVLVGLGEGVVLGVAYMLAHAPHAILFAAFTAIAAMIPIAAYVAIAAVALVLAIAGGVASAIVVAIFGVVVIFTADHFIRPSLIGGTTKLPFLWVLLGILGGLETFQLLGLFLGPAVMAALMMLWRELTGVAVE